jgi:hypothetical protein
MNVGIRSGIIRYTALHALNMHVLQQQHSSLTCTAAMTYD